MQSDDIDTRLDEMDSIVDELFPEPENERKLQTVREKWRQYQDRPE